MHFVRISNFCFICLHTLNDGKRKVKKIEGKSMKIVRVLICSTFKIYDIKCKIFLFCIFKTIFIYIREESVTICLFKKKNKR